jgi:hypothetical protein
MRITIDQYRNNPQMRLALELAARRARAQRLRRHFANHISRTYSRTKARHAASTHLAHQG